eukprot:scaffold10499_cov72-Skeletonema_dohrnii-CCMP3373.AAC.1
MGDGRHDLMHPSNIGDARLNLIMTSEALNHDNFSRCHQLLTESTPPRSPRHHSENAIRVIQSFTNTVVATIVGGRLQM